MKDQAVPHCAVRNHSSPGVPGLLQVQSGLTVGNRVVSDRPYALYALTVFTIGTSKYTECREIKDQPGEVACIYFKYYIINLRNSSTSQQKQLIPLLRYTADLLDTTGLVD